MTIFTTVAGFSLFGLAARVGQLGIQRRGLFENPAGHAIAVGVFGAAGYALHGMNERNEALLVKKRAEIAARRAAAAEEAS
ncbi:uncharacterized protein BXZ73DRAFT_96126 [Epithele typhae]|uniref:uncharacterized protein n=1 Tax=Epithele typhae TaxID=378194 RepID=UPI0020079B8D|nr:uncharacterized protein BXZ73DRAFT_96126 [Epithele typhae]KAH9945137.1 hypothetical protein BXZ73DRAFT_96126 [Epithele typhae]